MAYDVGTLKLLDYSVQVGTTGIVFVAALSGFLTSDGVAIIDPLYMEWARHRAASQLAFMGLVRGDIFAFMRESVPMSLADASALVGYPIGDITAWESGVDPLPYSAWESMADFVCTLDHRPAVHAMQTSPDFRPRVIRIVPDIPMISNAPLVNPPPPCGNPPPHC